MESYKKTKFYQLTCHFSLSEYVLLITEILGPCLFCVINFAFPATGEVFFVAGEASNNFNPAISESFDFRNNYKFICSDTDEKQKFFSNIGPWLALGAVIGVGGYFLWKWLNKKPSSDGSGDSNGSSDTGGNSAGSDNASVPEAQIVEFTAADLITFPIVERFKDVIVDAKWNPLTSRALRSAFFYTAKAVDDRKVAPGADVVKRIFLVFYEGYVDAIKASGVIITAQHYPQLCHALVEVARDVFQEDTAGLHEIMLFLKENFKFAKLSILLLKLVNASQSRKAIFESVDASVAFQKRLFSSLDQDCRDRAWKKNSFVYSSKKKNFKIAHLKSRKR